MIYLYWLLFWISLWAVVGLAWVLFMKKKERVVVKEVEVEKEVLKLVPFPQPTAGAPTLPPPPFGFPPQPGSGTPCPFPTAPTYPFPGVPPSSGGGFFSGMFGGISDLSPGLSQAIHDSIVESGSFSQTSNSG